MPKALAKFDELKHGYDDGHLYGAKFKDFPYLEEGDKCQVAESDVDLEIALLEEAGCQNMTVLQKLNGEIDFGEIQLCGGEKPKCYIRNTCAETTKTTTITTTTITVTTTTTTTVLYECHCKVFAEGQGPGCQGNCCALSSDGTGGSGSDQDCMTETTENKCNGRTNGANQKFCVYESHAHWETLKMS